MKKRLCALSLLLLWSAARLHAGIQLPALIADNMVLQQRAKVTLWGKANAGEQVVVKTSWGGKPLTAITDEDGNWQLEVRTPQADGKEQSILFMASDTIMVRHILAGEVWLASGQSNMEFYMDKGEGWRTGVLNYEQEIAAADYPAIRMIDVPNTVADSPAADFRGQWEVCTPQHAGNFSAVAYYFAVHIHRTTGYPVGIINATWGGTPAESWTRKAVLEQDSVLRPILERYAEACAAYPERYADYKEKLRAWKADTSSTKKGAPKEPIGPRHNKSPSKLYNGMIAPLLPCHIRGVIWYQGESNAGYAWQYRTLFPAMIRSWRQDFRSPDLPFYFVQIAPHKGQNPVIREAQLYTYQQVAHTGMVVTTDVGDARNIHPRNKKTVGDRLALWALHEEYGRHQTVCSGPLYRSMKTEAGRIVLTMTHAEGMKAQGDALTGFAIAGKDQHFVPASARISGHTIEVWSDAVAVPVAVRFAWDNVPEANLFNGAGLPASPFRTDHWSVPAQDKR